jgi:hypothetical protein
VPLVLFDNYFWRWSFYQFSWASGVFMLKFQSYDRRLSSAAARDICASPSPFVFPVI